MNTDPILALKEKAVLERTTNEMAEYIFSIIKLSSDRCIRCPLSWEECGNVPCVEAITAHFKAKAEKGGR